MTGPQSIRALVVDGDPNLIDDYQYVLNPVPRESSGRMFAVLEDELFGEAVRHRDFPELDLSVFENGQSAVDAVRTAVADGRPFTVAFIDSRLPAGLDGLRTAEQVRAADADIYIVIVSAACDIHPVELSARIPPADQLFYIRKPFHGAEIQQLVLALSARWRGEHGLFGGGRPTGGAGLWRTLGGSAEAIRELPAAAMVFDRRDRLLFSNEEMAKLFPELADLLAPGTRYEEIQRRMALELLPKDRLYRVESWVSDRLDWHARSGGVLEQKLRGQRWVLVTERTGESGETYCLYNDITSLKRRESSRAMSSHMTQTAQSFASLYRQLDVIVREAREGQERGSARRRAGGDIAHLGGSAAWGDVTLQSLTGKLEAIAQVQDLTPEVLGLNRLVGEIARKARGMFAAPVEVEVIAGAGLWPVMVDTTGFASALSELVKNAAEAMVTGGRLTVETANVRIGRDFVSSRSGLAAGEYVRVSVQDSGPGMTVELAERVLNPFFTSKGDQGHLGLGLSAVYGFACQSGGYLEIEGGEGRGATINLYFPRAEEVGYDTPEDDAAEGSAPSGAAVRSAAGEGTTG